MLTEGENGINVGSDNLTCSGDEENEGMFFLMASISS